MNDLEQIVTQNEIDHEICSEQSSGVEHCSCYLCKTIRYQNARIKANSTS